jgi:hypothetical protein
MARYASPHQLALNEEIVPLDGLKLIDADGAAKAERVEDEGKAINESQPIVEWA